MEEFLEGFNLKGYSQLCVRTARQSFKSRLLQTCTHLLLYDVIHLLFFGMILVFLNLHLHSELKSFYKLLK